jgi:hypothetical protein
MTRPVQGAAQEPRTPQLEEVAKKLVISWDADQDLEFDEAMDDLRALLGFVLSNDPSPVLAQAEGVVSSPSPDSESATKTKT